MPTDLQTQSAAHRRIQQRRVQASVPVGPGGVLSDYVPFYFGARSPMLYANHRGQVQDNPGGQRPIVYLVSSVDAVAAATDAWVFTDGHAVMAPLTRFFDDQAHLEEVDWDAVHARDWFDTQDAPDRKRRKQAEFLVHRFCSFEWVTEIAVIDEAIAGRVAEITASAGVVVPVVVRQDWYYL